MLVLLQLFAFLLGAQGTAPVTATPAAGGASKTVEIGLKARTQTLIISFQCDKATMVVGEVTNCTSRAPTSRRKRPLATTVV